MSDHQTRPAAATADPAGEGADHGSELTWHEILVAGRRAHYGVAGGTWAELDESARPTIVFLHGWGLANRTYAKAIASLVATGARVVAPSLPGFGRTADLPDDDLGLFGFASWLDAFLVAIGQREPVVLVGHSFGGGVAILAADELGDRVRGLVLVNSIGGSAWRRDGSVLQTLGERPLWDWGLHLQRDLLPWRQVSRVLPVILRDGLANLVRQPVAFWRNANIARTADLVTELERLKQRGLPIVVLWGEDDAVIPRASSEALCAAVGREDCVAVSGSHSWILADPEGFGEIMTNVVAAAERAGGDPRRVRRSASVVGASADDAVEIAPREEVS